MMFGHSKTPHGDSNLLSREPLVAFGAQHVLALTPTASISVSFFFLVCFSFSFLFPFSLILRPGSLIASI
jgi:hypothetical protein